MWETLKSLQHSSRWFTEIRDPYMASYEHHIKLYCIIPCNPIYELHKQGFGHCSCQQGTNERDLHHSFLENFDELCEKRTGKLNCTLKMNETNLHFSFLFSVWCTCPLKCKDEPKSIKEQALHTKARTLTAPESSPSLCPAHGWQTHGQTCAQTFLFLRGNSTGNPVSGQNRSEGTRNED